MKSLLFVVVFTAAALNLQASQNNIFKSDTSEIDVFQSNEEAEMELKAWMLDAKLFRKFIMDGDTGFNPCNEIIEADEEKELPLETWMFDRELLYVKFKNEKLERTPIAKWEKLK